MPMQARTRMRTTTTPMSECSIDCHSPHNVFYVDCQESSTVPGTQYGNIHVGASR